MFLAGVSVSRRGAAKVGGVGRCRYLRKMFDVCGEKFSSVKIVNAGTCGVDVNWRIFRGRAGILRKPREIKGAEVGWMEVRNCRPRKRVFGAALRFWLISQFLSEILA